MVSVYFGYGVGVNEVENNIRLIIEEVIHEDECKTYREIIAQVMLRGKGHLNPNIVIKILDEEYKI